jgi:hypothetical protein
MNSYKYTAELEVKLKVIREGEADEAVSLPELRKQLVAMMQGELALAAGECGPIDRELRFENSSVVVVNVVVISEREPGT